MNFGPPAYMKPAWVSMLFTPSATGQNTLS